MVTIKDIALALGVVPSTVTRALADSPRISIKTRKRVKQKAEELGYVANAAAKMMRGRNSTLIGLLIPDIENSFYAQVAKSVSDVCNQNGFQLVLAVTEDHPDYEERHIRELVAARCAGIVTVPTPALTKQSASMLATKNVSQLIRRNHSLDADWYGIDDVGAIRTATRYLQDLGHKRIALICGEDILNSGRERHSGYVSALIDRGYPVDKTLIFRGPPIASFSEKAACRLKALENPPSAIISAGSGLTEGMLNAVTSWSPVEQNAISLIGYSENNAFRWWCGTGLTTIDLPLHQITTDLCSHLLQKINAKATVPVKPESHRYSSHLLLRGSVKPYSVDKTI